MERAIKNSQQADELKAVAEQAKERATEDSLKAVQSLKAQIEAYKLNNEWEKARELLKGIADKSGDVEEVDFLRKDENPGKYNAMFERRASKGQCFTQPYLGTRECSCSFRLVNSETDKTDTPISESRDLGIMLYDMDFDADIKTPPAMFYRVKMESGVIIVPPKNIEEILR